MSVKPDRQQQLDKIHEIWVFRKIFENFKKFKFSLLKKWVKVGNIINFETWFLTWKHDY